MIAVLEQIRGRTLVVEASGFLAQLLPNLRACRRRDRAKPGPLDRPARPRSTPHEASQLRNDGIVGVVLQHGHHGVVVALDASSGMVTMSFASNARALATMKQTFGRDRE